MTVASVVVATKKFLFGICNCTVEGLVGTDEFLLVLGTLYVFGYVHVRSHVPQGMDSLTQLLKVL